jgi:hypothetical protein
MIHGSIVFRRTTFLESGGYDSRYRYCADLELYDRLIPRCRTANIPRPLLGLRRHQGQGSLSPAATEEGIQIYMQRLASGRYSAEEVEILHQALSLWFLRRAYHGYTWRRPAYLMSNFVRAIRLSPFDVARCFMPQTIRQNYNLRTWKLGEYRLTGAERSSIPT